MAEDFAAAPVAGQQHITVGRWPAVVLKIESSATRTAAIIGKWRHNLIGKVHVQRRIAVVCSLHDVRQTNIPAATVVGVVAREHVHERIKRDIDDVSLAPRVDF